MPEMPDLFVLGLGFVLGLKHATDPDHVVAVTTFVGKERHLSRACSIGLFWGVGHTVALSLAGFLVVGMRISISAWLAAWLEFAVAVMLVILGARLIASVHRKAHRHHDHFRWTRFGFKPFLAGMVHGAAGSAALTLLVLSTIASPVKALVYILIFGAGSIIGMLVISILVALPFYWAKDHIGRALPPIQIGAGVFSCVFGLYLGVTIWRSLA